MRPSTLKTRIFLDGGNPEETKTIMSLLGFLDGQTTNPTLVAKNPDVRKHLEQGKFSSRELLEFYREVVRTLSQLMPEGSISIEVYADASTSADIMLEQGRTMFAWIPNAHIKFPTSKEGLKAAEKAVREGLRVNMTLCFTQEQAAAVYAATRGTSKGQVFVSPFIGRLDDQGENGMDLIASILKMYKNGDGHVEVLTASVRTLDHLFYALKLGSHIITAPFEVLLAWGKQGMPIPEPDYSYNAGSLKPIPYQEIDLSRTWDSYAIRHPLTDKGMERFSSDWNALIQ
ncbi:MAG: transaldolase family protein [Nitrospirota bacterium]